MMLKVKYLANECEGMADGRGFFVSETQRGSLQERMSYRKLWGEAFLKGGQPHGRTALRQATGKMDCLDGNQELKTPLRESDAATLSSWRPRRKEQTQSPGWRRWCFGRADPWLQDGLGQQAGRPSGPVVTAPTSSDRLYRPVACIVHRPSQIGVESCTVNCVEVVVGRGAGGAVSCLCYVKTIRESELPLIAVVCR